VARAERHAIPQPFAPSGPLLRRRAAPKLLSGDTKKKKKIGITGRKGMN
jgi:hypothetical protein